ncbi:argininosuccinate lyase [Granulosicoccus antarcticus]|uniref:Argininosuccinate lyase n=1 Tax=Granulosicoccus antarcticus IMCC3135 TaxID=1192854 RepID=A0A2Z2P095_9GAMM|nr:argininosuccinate lyase [Granulosicoccus antarcticus]ASJ75488.1 Argininosuccinate lyase [Granulosicoccus antarcticus IMCC3135]
MSPDKSVFPDPVYRDTVLAPLFDGVKQHYAGSMAAINQAHLLMLARTGILEGQSVQAIAQALRAIDNEVNVADLNYTGEYEDYFFLVESQLKKRLGPDMGGMLHTARSRNDMDHTVFKMVLRERCDQLEAQCLQLAGVIHEKALLERDTLIVAYTHGQPAQPSTFGHYLSAVLEVLLADITRLQQARKALDLCPMGAAAITTSGFPIDRDCMADLLGFTAPKRNSYGCIASVDYVTGLYSAIKLIFVHLGRVIQDMAFWSAFEVGQLYVPNSLVQISSIMPQKRNPVPIEHMRHLSSLTAGRCDMIVNTMHNTPFTDMNDSEGEVQSAGYAAFDSGTRVVDLLSAFMASVSINEVRVASNADAACITITELADSLVRQEALSFRQAHEIAAATANTVIAEGLALQQGFAAFSEAFKTETSRASQLSEEQFMQAVSLRNFVTVRDRFGGPAPAAMDEALGHYGTQMAELLEVATDSQTRLAAATQRRGDAFDALLEV